MGVLITICCASHAGGAPPASRSRTRTCPSWRSSVAQRALHGAEGRAEVEVEPGMRASVRPRAAADRAGEPDRQRREVLLPRARPTGEGLRASTRGARSSACRTTARAFDQTRRRTGCSGPSLKAPARRRRVRGHGTGAGDGGADRGAPRRGCMPRAACSVLDVLVHARALPSLPPPSARSLPRRARGSRAATFRCTPRSVPPELDRPALHHRLGVAA